MCSWHRFTLCCTKTCNKRQQWIYKSIAFYQCVREIHRRNKSAHSSNNNYEKSMRRRKRKSRNEHLTQKLSERKLCSRIRSDIIFLSSLFSLLFFHSLCVCVCVLASVFFIVISCGGRLLLLLLPLERNGCEWVRGWMFFLLRFIFRRRSISFRFDVHYRIVSIVF